MAEPMHLVARFLHVGAAIVWVGYLAVVAWVLLPASRGQGTHAPNLGPVLKRLTRMRWVGPVVFLLGAWLVTASGHSWSMLTASGAWGHGVMGAMGLAVVMMGLEHGLLFPRMSEAHQGPSEDREGHLGTAQTAATLAAILGFLAALMMVYAGVGGL